MIFDADRLCVYNTLVLSIAQIGTVLLCWKGGAEWFWNVFCKLWATWNGMDNRETPSAAIFNLKIQTETNRSIPIVDMWTIHSRKLSRLYGWIIAKQYFRTLTYPQSVNGVLENVCVEKAWIPLKHAINQSHSVNINNMFEWGPMESNVL